MTLNLCHHDKPSLLAGKLHAVLSRKWTKGRDLYDLVWYLADRTWPAPNLALLNAALAQTGWKGPVMTAATGGKNFANGSRHWTGNARARMCGRSWSENATSPW